MTILAHHAHFDRETRNAFNELLVMDQISAMPVAAVLRVLKTIPAPVLEAALSAASRSPSRDASGCHAGSHPQGSR